MFITAAYAQTTPAAGGGGLLLQMAPLIAIVVIMYFLILRPQQQRMKAHREMISAIKRGDVVVTSGGIIGKVTRVLSDDEIQVELAEGVRVRVVRGTVSEVRTRSDVREVEARKAARKDDADNDDNDGMEPADETKTSKKDN